MAPALRDVSGQQQGGAHEARPNHGATPLLPQYVRNAVGVLDVWIFGVSAQGGELSKKGEKPGPDFERLLAIHGLRPNGRIEHVRLRTTQRRKLMDEWAKFCESAGGPAGVVPLQHRPRPLPGPPEACPFCRTRA